MTNAQREEPDRTRDSVEQLEDAEMKNPITDDVELTEVAEGFEPDTRRSSEDDGAGPVPRTTQMPR